MTQRLHSLAEEEEEEEEEAEEGELAATEVVLEAKEAGVVVEAKKKSQMETE